LFNESQGRALVTVRWENAAVVVDLVRTKGLEAVLLGRTTVAPTLVIGRGENQWSWPVATLREAFAEAIPAIMDPKVE
jgi:phosphoribosylformylglycinamidine (FGAM) synthase-like enzyme